MTDEKKVESANAEAGSSTKDLIEGTGSSVNEITEGKPKESESQKKEVNLDEYVPKKTYEDLEKKLGENSEEMGELRDFATQVAPLIEKLKENPALTEAIMSDKIDLDLAQAVLDGKVTVEGATAVAQAHEEVKKEIGKEEYDKLSKADIEKLLSDKLKDFDTKMASKMAEVSNKIDNKELERMTADFVKNTPDFSDYADAIDDYLKEHTDEWNIEKVYYIVKGKAETDKARKNNDKNAAEAAKEIAANAGGGASSQSGKLGGRNLVDDLIAGGGNPNVI